jgi:hypothetical protein
VPIGAKAQPGFVYQGGRLQGLPGALARQVRGGNPPKLIVNDRQQLLGCGFSLVGSSQLLSYLTHAPCP